MSKRKTTVEFIQRAEDIHGDKYDYSKVIYVNNRTKVCIICPEHGEFWQTPSNHGLGKKCPICYGKYKKSTSQFIQKAKLIHGNKYDYSEVYYTNSQTKVCIICPIHGEFWQIPNNHTSNNGCPKCNGGVSINQKQFLERAKRIHHDKYDYSKVEYINAITNICIICPKHGEFWQTPNSHLSNHGCPGCHTSRGELNIVTYLKKHHIKFKQQKRFKECRHIKPLPFDFYLPEHNICVEYDGIQHSESVEFFGGEKAFIDRQKKDNIKTNYCRYNNIKLIRIRYDESIDGVLTSAFN